MFFYRRGKIKAMKWELLKLTITELKDLYRKETQRFISSLESGAPWEEVQTSQKNLRNLAILIDEKTSSRSKSGGQRYPGSNSDPTRRP